MSAFQKKKWKLLFILFTFSLLIIGCSAKSEKKLSLIEESLLEEDYAQAEKIYLEYKKELSKEELNEFNKSLLEVLNQRLEDTFELVKNDINKVESLKLLINFIDNLDFDNDELNTKVNSLRREIEAIISYQEILENEGNSLLLLELISGIPMDTYLYEKEKSGLEELLLDAESQIRAELKTFIDNGDIIGFFNKSNTIFDTIIDEDVRKDFVQLANSVIDENEDSFLLKIDEALVKEDKSDIKSILELMGEWKPELTEEYWGKLNDLIQKENEKVLLQYFNAVRDDFEGITYYIPKQYKKDFETVDLSGLNQAFYPVLSERRLDRENNRPFYPLDIYAGIKQESWLFIEKVYIKADDEVLNIFDNELSYYETDVSYPYIYEYGVLDSVYNSFDEEDIDKLKNAEKVVVRFQGDNNKHVDKVLSKEEIDLLTFAMEFYLNHWRSN